MAIRCDASTDICQPEHLRPRIGSQPQRGNGLVDKFDCPVCRAPNKVTLQAGTMGQRFIWCCHAAKCDPTSIREWLLERITADHLGDYARFREPAKPLTKDEQLTTALRKLRAVERALTEPGCSPAVLRIRMAAVIWNGGKIPDDRADFLALAERAGVGRSQRYEAWAALLGGRLRRQ